MCIFLTLGNQCNSALLKLFNLCVARFSIRWQIISHPQFRDSYSMSWLLPYETSHGPLMATSQGAFA